MRQREAIAGRFGGRLLSTHLSQVPVVELVAVEEAQNLPARAESDRLAEPLKGQPPPGLAAGTDVDLLVPGAKRFRHLELDQAVVVPAEGGSVRRLTVAQWPGADRIPDRRRQIREPAAERVGIDSGDPRAKGDGGPGSAKRGGRHAFSLRATPAHRASRSSLHHL